MKGGLLFFGGGGGGALNQNIFSNSVYTYNTNTFNFQNTIWHTYYILREIKSQVWWREENLPPHTHTHSFFPGSIIWRTESCTWPSHVGEEEGQRVSFTQPSRHDSVQISINPPDHCSRPMVSQQTLHWNHWTFVGKHNRSAYIEYYCTCRVFFFYLEILFIGVDLAKSGINWMTFVPPTSE